MGNINKMEYANLNVTNATTYIYRINWKHFQNKLKCKYPRHQKLKDKSKQTRTSWTQYENGKSKDTMGRHFEDYTL
jgi:hypothetical protein